MQQIDLEEKDELYYDDLIYKIRKLTELKVKESKRREKRINKRSEVIKIETEEGTITNISPFNCDLLYFMMQINKQIDVPLKRSEDLKNYKEIVEKNLFSLEYEKKQKIRKK